nr:MAG: hypothetical protein [Wufeng shrew picorna-like virus 27]
MAAPHRYNPQFYIGSVQNIRETLFSRPVCTNVFRTLFSQLPGSGEVFTDEKFIQAGVRRESLPVFTLCMSFMGITQVQSGYVFVPPRISNYHSAAYVIAYFAPTPAEFTLDLDQLTVEIIKFFNLLSSPIEKSKIRDMLCVFRDAQQVIPYWNDLYHHFKIARQIESSLSLWIPRPPKHFKLRDSPLWELDHITYEQVKTIIDILFESHDVTAAKLSQILTEGNYPPHTGHCVYALFDSYMRTPASCVSIPCEFSNQEISKVFAVLDFWISSTARVEAVEEATLFSDPPDTMHDCIMYSLKNYLECLFVHHAGIPSQNRVHQPAIPVDLRAEFNGVLHSYELALAPKYIDEALEFLTCH